MDRHSVSVSASQSSGSWLVGRSVSQLIRQSVTVSASQSVNHSVSQPASRSVSHSVSVWFSQSVIVHVLLNLTAVMFTVCVSEEGYFLLYILFLFQCRDRYLNMIIPREEGKVPLVRHFIGFLLPLWNLPNVACGNKYQLSTGSLLNSNYLISVTSKVWK